MIVYDPLVQPLLFDYAFKVTRRLFINEIFCGVQKFLLKRNVALVLIRSVRGYIALHNTWAIWVI